MFSWIPFSKVKNCLFTLSKCFEFKQGIWAFDCPICMNTLPQGLQLFQISYLHQLELVPDSRFACTAELSLKPSSLLWIQRADWLACFTHLKDNQATVRRGKLVVKSEVIRFSSVLFSKANSVPRLFSMNCCQLFKNIYLVHHAYYARGHMCNADSWVAKTMQCLFINCWFSASPVTTGVRGDTLWKNDVIFNLLTTF